AESGIRRPALWMAAVIALGSMLLSPLASSDPPRRLDPAAWGSDHVGQPIPGYSTGGQWLFCHRGVGATWVANPPHLTIRDVDEQSPALTALRQLPGGIADEIKLVLGDQRRQRFLKPAKGYGQLELLSAEWAPPRKDEPGKLISTANPHWD